MSLIIIEKIVAHISFTLEKNNTSTSFKALLTMNIIFEHIACSHHCIFTIKIIEQRTAKKIHHVISLKYRREISYNSFPQHSLPV